MITFEREKLRDKGFQKRFDDNLLKSRKQGRRTIT